MSTHPWSESLKGTGFESLLTYEPKPYAPPKTFAGRGGAQLAKWLFPSEDRGFVSQVDRNFLQQAGDTERRPGVVALTKSPNRPIPVEQLTPDVLAQGAQRLKADRAAAEDARHAHGGGVVGDLSLLALLVGGGVGTARAISKLRAIRESKPEDPMDKTSSFLDTLTDLPHGLMYPAVTVAATGGLAAGLNGMDVLSDKVREAILRRRKQKAISEFQQMLMTAPEKQSAVGRAVGDLSDLWFEKAGEAPNWVPEWASSVGEHGQGILTTAMLMSLLGGAAIGKRFALKDDPNQAVLSALSLAVKRRQMSRPPVIQLQQVPGHSATGRDMVTGRSKLVRAPFDTPVVLPRDPSDTSEEDVGAKDLSKMAGLLKFALEIQAPGDVPGASAPAVNGGKGWLGGGFIENGLDAARRGFGHIADGAEAMTGINNFVKNDIPKLKAEWSDTQKQITGHLGGLRSDVSRELKPVGDIARSIQGAGSWLKNLGGGAMNWMSGALGSAGQAGGNLLGNLFGGGYAKS